MLRRMSKLLGDRVRAADGELGSLRDLYFDDSSWSVRYFLVDTCGRLERNRVLVVPVALGGIDETERAMDVQLTRGQLKDSPALDGLEPVSRSYEAAYYRHLGWPPYWRTEFSSSSAPPSEPAGERRDARAGEHDVRLRSAVEAAECEVEACDGQLGRVEDFFVDDGDWMLRYLEIEACEWLPGKKVLIACRWIERARWSECRIVVEPSRAEIRGAPAYDASAPVAPAYERELARHYGR